MGRGQGGNPPVPLSDLVTDRRGVPSPMRGLFFYCFPVTDVQRGSLLWPRNRIQSAQSILLSLAPLSCRKGTCYPVPGYHRERHAAWYDADGIPDKARDEPAEACGTATLKVMGRQRGCPGLLARAGNADDR